MAGPSVIAATLIAGLIAAANGLASAELASAHPVSGGTYEYGYVWLSPAFGFTAGWMFMLAKSASAPTAALGLFDYLLDLVGAEDGGWHVPPAVVGAIALTAFVAGGIRRSNRGNAVVAGGRSARPVAPRRLLNSRSLYRRAGRASGPCCPRPPTPPASAACCTGAR